MVRVVYRCYGFAVHGSWIIDIYLLYYGFTILLQFNWLGG